jgi:hypothetical protein
MLFLFVSMHLTMASLVDDDQHTPPQSPRTKGIVQALVHEVKKHMEGLDHDVQMTNEKIGVLEATQLANDTKLGTMVASVAHIDTSLAALLRRFDDLVTREHDRQQGHNNYNNNHLDEQVEDNWDGYSADLELDNHNAHCPAQHNHHGSGGHRRREVHNNDDVFKNSSLRYHLLMANMILMLIFLRNWSLNKNLHVWSSLKMLGLEQPLVNSLILLLFVGQNMAKNILMTYHRDSRAGTDTPSSRLPTCWLPSPSREAR